MSTETKYHPRAGSLPSEVIWFLTRNPDEMLTVDDIVEKFDCVKGNVHTTLRLAVEASELKRARSEDGEYFYQAGSALLARVARSTETPAPLDITIAPTPYKRRVRAQDLPALHNIVIEDDVPLPRHHKSVADFKSKLLELKPGQSFRLPLSARNILHADVTHLHKTTACKFTTRVNTYDDSVRVWRLESVQPESPKP